MEWQSIETAPKDGTRVLVFVPGFFGEIFTAEFDCEQWQLGVWARRPQKPTHWMPLPDPPKEEG